MKAVFLLSRVISIITNFQVREDGLCESFSRIMTRSDPVSKSGYALYIKLSMSA